MADTQDLLRLADEVTAATGPDRELDCMIWAAVNGLAVVWTGGDDHILIIDGHVIGSIDPGKHSRNFGCNRRETGPGSIPAYTASLDAAMSLVPEGWAVEGMTWWPASPEGASNVSTEQSSVRMVGTSIERMGRRMIWGHGGKDGRVEASAATPALALCAAALKARAHSTKETSNHVE